jgi:predicted RNase H-like HicB family nuclease
MSTGREIRPIEEDDGWWSGVDEETGVASQGETRAKALENLDEAVALPKGEIRDEITDDEEFLRDIGIDPDEIPDEPKDLPDFMQWWHPVISRVPRS